MILMAAVVFLVLGASGIAEAQDTEDPVTVCKGIAFVLSPAGTVTISALDVDGGSTDNVEIRNRTV